MAASRNGSPMARRSADLDDPDDLEDEDEEPRPRRSRSASGHRSARRTHPPVPVRRWRGPDDASDADDEEDEASEETFEGDRPKPPVFWRARDSLYFEPLVALAIIVVLIVGMYAYTQNWPPVYVVESSSMQHGDTDILGLINTGDLVLAQKLPTSSIQTYVDGYRNSYSTYGEYGDVILYSPNGQGSTPIIHRAILYLSANPDGSYNASDLAGLPCGGPNAFYATPGTPTGCGTTELAGQLELFGIGWNSVTVNVDLSSPALGHHSGFLTMGDNNFVTPCNGPCLGIPDQSGSSTPTVSQLVEPGWVIGAARGMIPWFGAVKLAIEGNTQYVPPQTWQYLGLTIAGIILLAFGVHYALRAAGVEDPRRKAEEDARAAEDDDLEPAPPSRGRWVLTHLRPWRRTSEEDTVDDIDGPPPKARPHPKTRSGRRGRPTPKVRRGEKGRRHRRSGDDDL